MTLIRYNENDKFTAQWLRNLIKVGALPAGEVDERDIRDLRNPPGIFHAFAGIGGWAYALELAGWPADRPVWTGSCPCQPFSSNGLGGGEDDPRHLWPEWYRLIRNKRPPTIFGEQVASPAGKHWLSRVQADLEALDYSFGAASLCAAGVGAPHIRQRLYWVAYAHGELPSKLSDDLRAGAAEELAPWARSCKVRGRDGTVRLLEPHLRRVAHGVPGQALALCALGNALVPQVAAAFIRAACR